MYALDDVAAHHRDHMLTVMAETLDSGRDPSSMICYIAGARALLSVAWGFPEESRKVRVMAALGEVGRVIGAETVVLCQDMLINEDAAARPLEDPAATEALFWMAFARSGECLGAGERPYRRGDDGTVCWDPERSVDGKPEGGGAERFVAGLSGLPNHRAVRRAVRDLSRSCHPVPLAVVPLTADVRDWLVDGPD